MPHTTAHACHRLFNQGMMLETYVKHHFAGKTGLLLPADEMELEVFQRLRFDLLDYGYDMLENWKTCSGGFAIPCPDASFCSFFQFVEMPQSAAKQVQSKYEDCGILLTAVIDGKITSRAFRSFFHIPPQKRNTD